MSAEQMTRGVWVRKSIAILLAIWLILSMIYFAAYMLAVEFEWQFLYYYVWLVAFGLPLWFFRRRVKAVLQNWQAPGWVKFFLLAYGMVMLEEVLAALFTHLDEGFNLWLYLRRITQFWAFNILAFTGLIFATWLLFTRVQYTFGEMFCLTGLAGLYSERVVFSLPTQPQVFIVFAPIVLFTYGLILSPALMSGNTSRRRALPFLLRCAAMVMAWYVFSQPPVWLLGILRVNYPFLFPPCGFIPCG